ncbi:GNAT family N-acetyltransferase [Cupriavidus basilensis]|jgi:amino-acid N-acetyltransferase|uniref:GNAT family N-acetyltransferase n=1 Tax=Cupriavidus basilensis TaxID=68895 RepID=A0A643FQC8_9BURK|nr:GNAT family N-acetyltransferase [Cupriavidus basilensis]QOT80747.1 GNAT family N-acetyltransferase [Cupriavidus basilensis]
MRPRQATTTDLSDVAALLQSCSLPAGGIDRQSVQFHVSRDKQGLLGCAGFEAFGGNVALVRGLAVAKRARRAGLAGLLLSAMVSDVRLRGIDSLVVGTDTSAGYFSRLGFAPVELAALPPELRESPEFSAASLNTQFLKVEL